MATIISYSELFCTLIIFVILVFSVLTAARERYKDDIAESIEEVRGLSYDMQQQFTRLYDIALGDVETILLRNKNSADLINWLRKKRGLPEIALPEKEEQISK